jgi:hypothetical protein
MPGISLPIDHALSASFSTIPPKFGIVTIADTRHTLLEKKNTTAVNYENDCNQVLQWSKGSTSQSSSLV